ncbi:hypothetical protein [Aliivibrio fischeri]|uniref:hypothetical protein n=1 Tax=Aliivibrio fischeri TaxID=668 RepID=UPI0007C5395C|nr:hypothetical protein [Aliivibrio fischeri]
MKATKLNVSLMVNESSQIELTSIATGNKVIATYYPSKKSNTGYFSSFFTINGKKHLPYTIEKEYKIVEA